MKTKNWYWKSLVWILFSLIPIGFGIALKNSPMNTGGSNAYLTASRISFAIAGFCVLAGVFICVRAAMNYSRQKENRIQGEDKRTSESSAGDTKVGKSTFCYDCGNQLQNGFCSDCKKNSR
jgi:hypothetical protein